VGGVARGRLLRLRKERLLMADERRAERAGFVRRPSAGSRSSRTEGGAGKLDNRVVQRNGAVEGRPRPEDAVTADHGRFDHLTLCRRTTNEMMPLCGK